jgi:hypothetical protein
VAVAEAKALPKLDPVPKDQERTRVLSRVKKLEDGFNSQKPTLQEISEYVLPYRGQWQGSQGQEQRGKRKGLKIINNTAGRSMSILSSGMMAGLTSPGRPWFKLSTQDPDLSEYTPVRSWLDDVARSMRTVFARSNLYNVLPGVYTELGGFGTSSLQEVDDPMSIVRFYPYTIGTYALAQDDRLVVDTFCRRYTSTVRQVVAKFGAGGRVSERVLQQYACGKFEESVEVIHIIQPNYRRQLGVAGWPGAPFLEEYWEANSNVVGYPLQRTGISERALFAPRWDVTGNDVWGTGLCHQIIGDVKQLQFLERRKEDVLEKHTAPPLEAGTELRGKRISLLAGDVNYTNPSSTGGAQIKPIVLTHPNAYQYVAEDIGTIERRIRSACYEDLFLMLANDTRSGITAREVEERHQEKMLVLGPVLERLNEELLDPIIDRTFAIMQRRSLPVWRGILGGNPLLPPPPANIDIGDLRVEYTSILAQAAKATNTRGLEAFGQFVGGLAGLNPDVMDKVDLDQMVDEYADAQGVPARIIRSDDDVKALRAAKAQQARAQQMASMAPAAKDFAQALNSAATAVPQEGSVLENMGNNAAAQAGLSSPLGGP